ncbi:MAG: transpeptidase family protein [Ignavibacteriales bacterium]|nr:transpeptidase family protein [Ignavibacteriales bacterium]
MNNSRAILIIILICFCFVALVIKLFTIQIVEHEKHKFHAENLQNKKIEVLSQRGSIKDRNGEVLAFTKDDVSFYADCEMLKQEKYEKDRNLIIKRFAEVFNKSESHYKNMIMNGKNNVLLEKKVSKGKAILLRDFFANGFITESDYTRIYPYGSMASHILGYVNKQNKGVAGVESKFNDILYGHNGLLFIERDVTGKPVSINEEFSMPARNGDNLILTINKTYQGILEEELEKGLNQYKGNSATGIIMNPNTGEVLAIANIPNYDPNNYNLFDDNARRNRAVTDTYEPGSTIKPIILSILFEEEMINENQHVKTESGYYEINGISIKDSESFETMKVKEVLEKSSNIGMVKLTQNLEPNLMYKYLRDFGLGNQTSVTLPSEAAGLLKKPRNFSKYTKASMSFGYELSVTPLQLITAYCALINGGKLFRPMLIKSIKDEKGNVIENFEPVQIRKVISDSTSNRMKNLMIGVIENGTGKNARLENVYVGGKTGTTEKLVNKTYSNKVNISSFIGFFPADNPKIICLIIINEPQEERFGGKVSAPIFKNIAERLIATDIALVPPSSRINREENSIENFYVNLDKKNSYSDQLILNNIPNESNTTGKTNNTNYAKGTMPNLYNMSKRDAINLLSKLGIKYKVSGNGFVISQSIESNTKVNNNSIVTIKCENPKTESSIRLN